MLDFGESGKMIKISGKENKSKIYNGFNGNISFFINKKTSSDETFFMFFYILGIDETRGNLKRYKGGKRV